MAILYARPASADAPHATPASCRQAVNGLISLLDAGKDDGALYRETYDVVVSSCGPEGGASEPPPSPAPSQSRAACHDLAAAMVDLIEDDKMDSAEFAHARNAFARACAPR